MLKYSPANAKTSALRKVKALSPYLPRGRKIYSLDLLSGHYCPYASDCLSKAVEQADGTRKIEDGPDTLFRCFSASQEVQYPNVFASRKHNSELLQEWARDYGRLDMALHIDQSLPLNLGVLRIHVAGDFFNQVYFDAMALVARRNPDRLFYAYTKSLPYWVRRLGQLTENFVLTASRGGRRDNLIDEHGLREARVVFSENEALSLGLEIDHDDSHAADPSKAGESFALLLHGTQPKGSDAAAALSALKGKGSYSRKKGGAK